MPGAMQQLEAYIRISGACCTVPSTRRFMKLERKHQAQRFARRNRCEPVNISQLILCRHQIGEPEQLRPLTDPS